MAPISRAPWPASQCRCVSLRHYCAILVSSSLIPHQALLLVRNGCTPSSITMTDNDSGSARSGPSFKTFWRSTVQKPLSFIQHDPQGKGKSKSQAKRDEDEEREEREEAEAAAAGKLGQRREQVYRAQKYVPNSLFFQSLSSPPLLHSWIPVRLPLTHFGPQTTPPPESRIYQAP